MKHYLWENYIISFYQEIQSLNHHYALYLNLFSELKIKFHKNDFKNADPIIRENVAANLQQVRYSCTKCYIAYNSFYKSESFKGIITKEEKEDIDILYKSINDNYMIKLDELIVFVVTFNEFLLNNVVKNLLETSQDVLDSIYENGENWKRGSVLSFQHVEFFGV